MPKKQSKPKKRTVKKVKKIKSIKPISKKTSIKSLSKPKEETLESQLEDTEFHEIEQSSGQAINPFLERTQTAPQPEQIDLENLEQTETPENLPERGEYVAAADRSEYISAVEEQTRQEEASDQAERRVRIAPILRESQEGIRPLRTQPENFAAQTELDALQQRQQDKAEKYVTDIGSVESGSRGNLDDPRKYDNR